nr:reverse transcriptase domain, reverse transcriptase zinc-binding domain protein [Tanacetum cinerariifolium]
LGSKYSKSTAFSCKVLNYIKVSILNIMPFSKGELPVKYLGRLQLCKSVISSMHVYWASVLLIPRGIISDIQQLIRGFLWCNGEYKRGKAKVAWDDICLPKQKEDLGYLWYLIRGLAGMDLVPPILEDFMVCFQSMVAKRTCKSVVGKILLAASTYYIWMERNNRVYKNTRRSPKEIRDIIMTTVRLKLVTFRFKNSSRVKRLLSFWKMPSKFWKYGC